MGLKSWKGSFMQPEITVKQRGWEVDSVEGTLAIPGDVQEVPDILATGEGVNHDDPLFDHLLAMVEDYVPCSQQGVGRIDIVEGYFARVQAPGYMDASDWSCFKTVREAKSHLWEFYGPGD